MITIERLSLTHGLHNLTVTLPKNRLIGVLGANGAGKSSLLKSIAGITPPTQGRIIIDGQNADNLSHRQRSQLLAYLAQEIPLRWALSVYDTIALGLLAPLPAAAEREKVHAAADYFSITHLLQQQVQTLSGGERARVHLARCLMKNAPILLADEPIAALDPYYQIDIMQHLQYLSKHMTCVVVLHHLSLAYEFCDNIVLLKAGQLVAAGATPEVMIAENLTTAFQISATIDTDNRSIHTIRKIN